MQSLVIKDAQTFPVVNAILDHRNGEDVLVTSQDDGTIVLGFTNGTVTINTYGETEES